MWVDRGVDLRKVVGVRASSRPRCRRLDLLHHLTLFHHRPDRRVRPHVRIHRGVNLQHGIAHPAPHVLPVQYFCLSLLKRPLIQRRRRRPRALTERAYPNLPIPLNQPRRRDPRDGFKDRDGCLASCGVEAEVECRGRDRHTALGDVGAWKAVRRRWGGRPGIVRIARGVGLGEGVGRRRGGGAEAAIGEGGGASVAENVDAEVSRR